MSAFVSDAVGILGKSRHQAEFLRIHSSSPALSALDEWFTEAVEWAAGRAGEHWPHAFANGSIHAFAFQPRNLAGNQLLCGVFGPSADSAGRQFPLIIAAPLQVASSLLATPEQLPFLFEGFWAQASEALGALLTAPHGDLHSVAGALRAAPALAQPEAAQLYSEWAGSLPLREFWDLLGMPFAGGDPSLALRWMLATVEPFRGTERPQTPLSLHVPLGQAAGGALCFWLDFVQRVLRWRTTLPSFFWSHDGQSGSATIHLGAPARSTLAELFLPGADRDEVCDLTRPLRPSLSEALPPLGPMLTAAVAHPQATVQDFLASIDEH